MKLQELGDHTHYKKIVKDLLEDAVFGYTTAYLETVRGQRYSFITFCVGGVKLEGESPSVVATSKCNAWRLFSSGIVDYVQSQRFSGRLHVREAPIEELIKTDNSGELYQIFCRVVFVPDFEEVITPEIIKESHDGQ